MAKLLKILLRLIGGVLEWTLVLLIFVAFAIRSYKFQTYLGHQATAYLSKELNTTIKVDKVAVLFFNRIALDGVLVLDEKKDTLASLGSVFVTLNKYRGQKKYIDIREVNLKKGKINLSREKEKGEFNFQFISDYFASSDTTPGKPFEIDLRKIKLTQVDFRYDDFRKTYSPFGLDYDHIHFKNVFLTANVNIGKKGNISAFVKHISLREKCGFELDRFSSKIIFDSKGLRMKRLHIQTPSSKIYFARMNLNNKKGEGFSDFVDKVVFDVDLKPSEISLKDISYFATALEGMDQKIYLSTVVTKRVKDLKIADLNLKTGKKTELRGTFNLPDFANLDKAFFDEKLHYAYLDFNDLEAMRMPKSMGVKHLDLGKTVRKLGYAQLQDVRLDGFYSEFVLKTDLLKTNLGSVEMGNGILFSEQKNRNSYTFQKSYSGEYDVKIDSFLLGQFIGDQTIGSLSGNFFLEGEIFSTGKIDFNSIKGDLKRFDYQDYAYQNIHIKEGSFVENVFIGKLDVKDDNLELTYDGLLDFNTHQRFEFKIDITEAVLDNLNLSKIDNNILKSSFSVDISGTNANNYSGIVKLEGLFYQEGDKRFDVPSMTIKMDRSEQMDVLDIKSDVLNASVKGKVDFATLPDDIQNKLNKILPALFKAKSVKPHKNNFFDYHIETLRMNEFLAIFVPGLAVEAGTTISGNFNEDKNLFVVNAKSNRIAYNEVVLQGLEVAQSLSDTTLYADYKVARLNLNDSLQVQEAIFHAQGKNGEIDSDLSWNPGTENESYFSWKTIINDIDSYFFNLNPSFFTVRNSHWDIVNNSQIKLAPDEIQIQHFKMQQNGQYLTIDGAISKDPEDILRMEISDLELEDFTSLFGLPFSIKGNLNGVVSVSDIYNNIQLNSDTKIRDLFLDGQEVGDINVSSIWDNPNKSVGVNGELYYRKNKTFDFKGNYYTERTTNSMNFDLDFDKTDIHFANAFMDPAVVSGIRGLLDGKLKVTGTPEKPQVVGLVNLLGGNAKVEMFGVNFGFDGKVSLVEDGIYIDNMPVTDEDGNMGLLNATVLHQNFQNWNYEMAFNLEDDAFALSQGRPDQPLDQFLVMNTTYKQGDMYYGKAYVTGRAEIFGNDNHMEIDVDLETESNTVVNFPMYGTAELQEGKFLYFDSIPGGVSARQKLDLTGVDLNMKFKVTPKAELRVLFDAKGDDAITAYGRGVLSIGVDNLGGVNMDGVFRIEDRSAQKRSVYNFYMPPVKEKFFIVPGGTISWTGDPVRAGLNLETYNSVQTSLNEIMPNLNNSSVKIVKEVRCMLKLSQTLLEPKIEFDINVPKATDAEKTAIAGIVSVPDELNKQFFSLLIVKKFQPLHGQMTAGSGAALEILSGQMNEFLDNLSKDVKINVDLKNQGQGETTGKVTTSKSFGNLIIKGSLGVENSASGASNQNSVIGDVNVEYLLNDDGTFRVSIFNESNDNTVIQEKSLGQFTQGAGLNYQEDFNNFSDFKMAQYFLDLFRKKGHKRYPIKKKRKQKKVPPISTNPAVKPENP